MALDDASDFQQIKPSTEWPPRPQHSPSAHTHSLSLSGPTNIPPQNLPPSISSLLAAAPACLISPLLFTALTSFNTSRSNVVTRGKSAMLASELRCWQSRRGARSEEGAPASALAARCSGAAGHSEALVKVWGHGRGSLPRTYSHEGGTRLGHGDRQMAGRSCSSDPVVL